MMILQLIGRLVKYFAILAAILYLADFAVFEVRRARGNAMGSVSVEQYLATQLKGNKEEYDYLGTSDRSCSITLFPQFALSVVNPPCWWLEKHKQQWQ